MSLYIRDPEVDRLATQLQTRTGAKTKTDAVRNALVNELKRQSETVLPSQKIAGAVTMIDEIRAEAVARGLKGQGDFDMKAFTDEMWGE
ncbi:type II toxin-antitoxin system VapB family antitoxin [Castellaniella sp.]|uniref:type II toxin-antitoxin system VapB family antitoxin n=1 Tax=Castellaniella sp. TaxID=1955812 RepID=UPI002AFEEE3C|nr:type II toxin-antitoxin system VapB family antitoxin [Castellaniella sp.]